MEENRAKCEESAMYPVPWDVKDLFILYDVVN